MYVWMGEEGKIIWVKLHTFVLTVRCCLAFCPKKRRYMYEHVLLWLSFPLQLLVFQHIYHHVRIPQAFGCTTGAGAAAGLGAGAGACTGAGAGVAVATAGEAVGTAAGEVGCAARAAGSSSSKSSSPYSLEASSGQTQEILEDLWTMSILSYIEKNWRENQACSSLLIPHNISHTFVFVNI